MKVVQINAVCDTGSTGRICRELNDELIRAGHAGIVLYGNGRADYRFACRVSNGTGVKVHGLLARVLGKQAAYSPSATRKILRILRLFQPDVVHLHNLHGNYVNLKPLLRYLARKNIPTVLTLHDCWFFTGKCTHYTEVNCFRWETGCRNCPKLHADIPSWFFDRTAQMWEEKQKLFGDIPRLAVIGVSDWITGEAGKSFLRNAKILRRIYNWVDPDVFYPRGRSGRKQFGISEEKAALLCIGSEWNRGSCKTRDLLALAQILPENCEVILAGAVSFGVRLPKNIKPVGYLSSREELAKLYSACDVYVHLSREDTFGSVIAEAISCGTPAVVYDSTACPEILGQGCGQAVPVGDVEAVLRAVRNVLDGEKKSWESSCLEYAAKQFLKDQCIAQTLQLYQELMKQEDDNEVSCLL